MSWRRFQIILKTSWRHLCKMSWRHFEDFLKTPWRCPKEVLKTFLQDALTASWQDVWKSLEDICLRRIYSSNIFDQDVFWRLVTETKIFVLIKTSWRHFGNIYRSIHYHFHLHNSKLKWHDMLIPSLNTTSFAIFVIRSTPR